MPRTDLRSAITRAALALAIVALLASFSVGATAAGDLGGVGLKAASIKKQLKKLRDRCAPTTVQLGTLCMMTSPYPLDGDELGRNDYFFATQKCAELGGFLPTAAQLIGAAPYVKLAGRVDDNEVTASTDVDETDGLKDRREMTSDLTTTASGSRAAGSQGVSEEARGNPNTGEPDPTPVPAAPSPETLQYVTVYDNQDHGGFAGSAPVGQPELFRCAFNKAQGRSGLR